MTTLSLLVKTCEVEIEPSRLKSRLLISAILKSLKKREKGRIVYSTPPPTAPSLLGETSTDSRLRRNKQIVGVIVNVLSVDSVLDSRITNSTCACAFKVRASFDVFYAEEGRLLKNTRVVVVTRDGIFLEALDRLLQCVVVSCVYVPELKAATFPGKCSCRIAKNCVMDGVIENVHVINSTLHCVLSHVCTKRTADPPTPSMTDESPSIEERSFVESSERSNEKLALAFSSSGSVSSLVSSAMASSSVA